MGLHFSTLTVCECLLLVFSTEKKSAVVFVLLLGLYMCTGQSSFYEYSNTEIKSKSKMEILIITG